jgi:hypothetical protein
VSVENWGKEKQVEQVEQAEVQNLRRCTFEFMSIIRQLDSDRYQSQRACVCT